MTEVVRRVEVTLDEADGVQAAQLAMSRLRDHAEGRLAASVYRLWEGRMWLIAQAGYATVFDGVRPDFGVLGRAVRTGRIERVDHGPDDPDWVPVAPELHSQVVVPVRDHLLGFELTAAPDDELIDAFERFAKRLVGRIRAAPMAAATTRDVARSLVTMVGLRTPDLIGEYALRLVARLAGLSAGRIVVNQPGLDPISVAWQSSESDEAPDQETVLRLTEAYHGFSTAVVPDASGIEQLVVPLPSGGPMLGGIVGVAPSIDPTNDGTVAVAAIAAQAVACLQRAALEASLVAAHRGRGEFIASLSHELRTPLTAVLGYSELLIGQHGWSDTERMEFALAIRDSARHLLDLVGDVLDIARSDADRLEVDRDRHFFLQPIVADVMPLVAPQAAARRVTIDHTVAPDLVVVGDPTRVRQILANLLSNAVKFTADGMVGIGARHADRSVVVTVEDHGEGISAEEMAKLFQPFSGRSNEAGRAGTGLGLVISRRLAEAMGGTLTLHSAGKGSGSTAVLTLPRGDAAAVEQEAAAAQVVPPGSSGNEPGPG